MISRTSHKFTVARNRKNALRDSGARKIQKWARNLILRKPEGGIPLSKVLTVNILRWSMLSKAAQRGVRRLLGFVIKQKSQRLAELKSRFKFEYIPFETSRADSLDLLGSIGSVLKEKFKFYPKSKDISNSLSIIAALVTSLNKFDFKYIFRLESGMKYKLNRDSLSSFCIAQFEFRTGLFGALLENLLKIRRFYDFEIPLKLMEHSRRLFAIHAVETALRFHFCGHLNRAYAYYSKAFAALQNIFKKCRAPGHPILGVMFLEMACLALSQGKIESARNAIKRSAVVFHFHEQTHLRAEIHCRKALKAKKFKMWIDFLHGMHRQREAAETRFAFMRTSLHRSILREWLKFAQESEARWEKSEVCHKRFGNEKCRMALVKLKENAVHEKHVKQISDKARVFREKTLKERMLKKWFIAIPLIKKAKVHRKRAALKWRQVLIKKAFYSWGGLVVFKQKARMIMIQWTGKTLHTYMKKWQWHHSLYRKATQIKKGARGHLARKSYRTWMNDSFQEFLSLSPSTVTENMSGKRSKIIMQMYYMAGFSYILASARANRNSFEYLLHNIESGGTHRVEIDFEIVRCLLRAHPKLNFHQWNLSWLLEGVLINTIELPCDSIVTGITLNRCASAEIMDENVPTDKMTSFLQHSDATRSRYISTQFSSLNAESRQIVNGIYRKKHISHYAVVYVTSIIDIAKRRNQKQKMKRDLLDYPVHSGERDSHFKFAVQLAVGNMLSKGISSYCDSCRIRKMCHMALTRSHLYNRMHGANGKFSRNTSNCSVDLPRTKTRNERLEFAVACAFSFAITALVTKRRACELIEVKHDSVEEVIKMTLPKHGLNHLKNQADDDNYDVLLISPPQIVQALKFKKWHDSTIAAIADLKMQIVGDIGKLRSILKNAIEETGLCQQWSNTETQRLYASLLKCNADLRLLGDKPRIKIEMKKMPLRKKPKVRTRTKKEDDEPCWIESSIVKAKKEQTSAEIDEHVALLQLGLRCSRRWKEAYSRLQWKLSAWELFEEAALEHQKAYSQKMSHLFAQMQDLDLQARQMNDAYLGADAICALSRQRDIRSQIRKHLIFACSNLCGHLDQLSVFASDCKKSTGSHLCTFQAFHQHILQTQLHVEKTLLSERKEIHSCKRGIQKLQYQAAIKMSRLMKEVPKERELYLKLQDDEQYIAAQVNLFWYAYLSCFCKQAASTTIHPVSSRYLVFACLALLSMLLTCVVDVYSK
jgi:hypothetical protein